MMIRTIIFLLGVSTIFGCSSFFKDTNTVVKQENFSLLHPNTPNSMTIKHVEWKVLTPEIARSMIDKNSDDFIFIALTPKHYENLSLNMQEIIRYIREQKEIIIYYRENVPNSKDLKESD